MTLPWTIGLDGGARAGVAAWQGSVVLATLTLDMQRPTATRVARSFRQVCSLAGEETPPPGSVFVAEKPFLGDSNPNRIPALVSLLKVAHYWEAVADLLGVTVLPQVHPSTWKSSLGFWQQSKEEVRLAVVEYLGVTVDSHAADALLLALHVHLSRYGKPEGATGLIARWRPKP